MNGTMPHRTWLFGWSLAYCTRAGTISPFVLIIRVLTLFVLPLLTSLIHWHSALYALLPSEVCLGYGVGPGSGSGGRFRACFCGLARRVGLCLFCGQALFVAPPVCRVFSSLPFCFLDNS